MHHICQNFVHISKTVVFYETCAFQQLRDVKLLIQEKIKNYLFLMSIEGGKKGATF